VIGIGEGLLLMWLFSAPGKVSIPIMILANYVSAWLGVWSLHFIVPSLPMDLNNAWRWFWGLAFATWCATVILEWPFVAKCLRGQVHLLKRSLWASLVVQTASYVLLFGCYGMASDVSLFTQMSIVAPSELSLPDSVLVYYIDTTDGSVHRRHLSGFEDEKVFDLHSMNSNDRMLAQPNAAVKDRWNIVARLETKDARHPRFVQVLANQPVEVASVETPSMEQGNEGTWFNFGSAPTLGSAKGSPWAFYAGFWPIQGLKASNSATHATVHFSYETPFGQWMVRNAVQLPSDKVLFQLGWDQICAFDPVTRRVALLWHGRGALPVLDTAVSH
jgi:hypothetical protein